MQPESSTVSVTTSIWLILNVGAGVGGAGVVGGQGEGRGRTLGGRAADRSQGQ